MQLKNYMEDIVWKKLDEIIKIHPGICTCQKCRYDIAAIALNWLPPHYVVTEQGQVFSKLYLLEQQFLVDVVTAITYGIEIVRKNPQHHSQKNE